MRNIIFALLTTDKKLRLASATVLSVLVLFQPLGITQALSDEQRNLYLKGINYFDLACSQVSAQTTSSISSIYMVGDSVTVGLYYVGEKPLEQALKDKGWSAQVDARGARSMIHAGQQDLYGNLPGRDKNGLEAIKADTEAIKSSDTVVIALGTNSSGTASDFKQQAKSAIKEVRSANSSANIFWVNISAIHDPSDNFRKHIREYNQVINTVANEENVTVIDAASASIELQGDKIHPSWDGYKTLADVVLKGLGNTSTGGSIPSSDDQNGNCTCENAASSGTSGVLSANVPEPWRSIIEEASKHPEVVEAKSDPNIVAATLWVENRGWPDINKEWQVSDAGAMGPWQFWPPTWQNLGRDGDGDGVKDPNNPKDAVVSAFLHSPNSLDKPLANTGYDPNKSAEENWETVVFDRNGNNLLSFVGSYNGDDGSSVEGGRIKDFPRGQNGDYIQMGYWLLATNFVYGWDYANQKKIDAKSAGNTSVSGGPTGNQDCSTATGEASGNFIWPADKQYPITDCWKSPRSGGRLHGGMDLGTPTGTPIKAMDGGEVVFAGTANGFGNTVTIKHPNGFWTLYGHLSSLSVSEGDPVDQGQEIGKAGATGGNYAPHLHFNVQKIPDIQSDANRTVNPMDHLPNDGRSNVAGCKKGNSG